MRAGCGLIAWAVFATFGLSGCVLAGAAGPNATPSASALAPRERAPIGTSLFDLGCDALASQNDLTTLFSASTGRPVAVELDPEFFDVSIVALKQSGALLCDWGDPYTYDSPSLALIVVPEADGAFDENQTALMSDPDDPYRTLDIFDGSVYQCRSDYNSSWNVYRCEWHILSEGVWVSVTLTGLLESTLGAGPDPDSDIGLVEVTESSALVGYLSRAVEAIFSAPRRDVTPSPTSRGSCADLIDIGLLTTLLPGTARVRDLLATHNQEAGVDDGTFGFADGYPGSQLGLASMRNLGYRYCSISPPPADAAFLTTFAVAPGGSWAFDLDKAHILDGIGPTISTCRWPSDDGPFCTLEALVGDTLVAVNTQEVSPILATVVLRNIVENLDLDQ
jgi:hypothetical protein